MRNENLVSIKISLSRINNINTLIKYRRRATICRVKGSVIFLNNCHSTSFVERGCVININISCLRDSISFPRPEKLWNTSYHPYLRARSRLIPSQTDISYNSWACIRLAVMGQLKTRLPLTLSLPFSSTSFASPLLLISLVYCLYFFLFSRMYTVCLRQIISLLDDGRRGAIFPRKERIKEGKQEAEGKLIDAESVGRRTFKHRCARHLTCYK